jgi:copper chaperone CopZ
VKTETIDLAVPAMTCENCVNNIKATLEKIEGISFVAPDLPTKRVRVDFDAVKVSPKQIGTALGKLGFTSHSV